MNYYNQNPRYNMNRAQRRKNGIKTEKVKKSSYTKEELEKVIKRELTNLLNEPYSETIKRERYRRLEPLIKEYQRQKEKETETEKQNTVQVPKKSRTSKEFYHKQQEQLKNNETYQRIMQNSYNRRREENVSAYTRQRAISAYQTQMNFSNERKARQRSAISEQKITKDSVSKQTKTRKNTTKKKTGFFSRLGNLFGITKTPAMERPKATITTPKKSQIQKTYRSTSLDRACNEFEKQLRNMKNYSQNIVGYQAYRNGRPLRFTERYI